MESSKIAIIIPSFNEEATILEQTEFLSKYGDVIIVDDGSTDNTLNVLKRQKCKIIKHDTNKGYDQSLTDGIQSALSYDFIVTTDADGEIPKTAVIDVIDHLKAGADLVLGERESFPRWGEYILNWVVGIKFKTKDILCGLKGYRTAKINPEFRLIGTTGAGITIDMLKNRNNYKSVKIKIFPRKNSSRFGSNNIQTNLKILRVLKYVW